MKLEDVKAAQHNWTREEYDAYIYAGIREQDEKGRIELAEKRRIERVVKQLHQNNIPLSIIAVSVELSENEVAEIIERDERD